MLCKNADICQTAQLTTSISHLYIPLIILQNMNASPTHKKSEVWGFVCFINPENCVRSTSDIKIHSEVCSLYSSNYQIIPDLCGFQTERDLTHLLPRFLIITAVMGLVHAGFRSPWNIHSVLGLLCCLSLNVSCRFKVLWICSIIQTFCKDAGSNFPVEALRILYRFECWTI